MTCYEGNPKRSLARDIENRIAPVMIHTSTNFRLKKFQSKRSTPFLCTGGLKRGAIPDNLGPRGRIMRANFIPAAVDIPRNLKVRRRLVALRN